MSILVSTINVQHETWVNLFKCEGCFYKCLAHVLHWGTNPTTDCYCVLGFRRDQNFQVYWLNKNFLVVIAHSSSGETGERQTVQGLYFFVLRKKYKPLLSDIQFKYLLRIRLVLCSVVEIDQQTFLTLHTWILPTAI